MILELTDAAVADLRSIREYTVERWGEEQEVRYLDAMWQKFEEIQADPTRWRFREDLFPKCQIAAQGRHVVLFCIQGQVLQIVRILHGAMDHARHIPNGFR